jgi:hypothetical protein
MRGVSGRPPTRLVYILSASHSGSTLLAMLLHTHPQICTAGELKTTALGDIQRYRCSCRRPILECPFWSAITRDLNAQGLDFDLARGETHVRSVASRYAQRLLAPLHRGPALELARDLALSLSPRWRAHRRRAAALDAALARAICARTGKPVIVDSSKVGIRLKYLLRNPELDVRVIRLIRDGRAVTLTYMDPAGFADASDPRLRAGGTGETRADVPLDVRAAAREWRRSNEEAEAIIGGLERWRWTEVRYDDLCLYTEPTLRRLFAFSGVDPSGLREEFRGAEHHVIGNGMRLDDSRAIRLDERWRDALSARDLAAFEAVAGAMNRRLGYGDPPRLAVDPRLGLAR